MYISTTVENRILAFLKNVAIFEDFECYFAENLEKMRIFLAKNLI